MRVTILGRCIKGLIRLEQAVGAVIQKKPEGVKWLLWHGNVDKALTDSGTSINALTTLPTADRTV